MLQFVTLNLKTSYYGKRKYASHVFTKQLITMLSSQ